MTIHFFGSKDKSMRTFPLLCRCLFLITLSLVFGSACRGQQSASAPQPEYSPTATIKDIMDAIVDPSADVVWESVQTIVTPAGVDERSPKTDEEWTNVRRGAIRVVEGTNLLMMPGRHVARPGEKSETPGVELEPEEIEANINKDRAQWNRLAKGLYDTSMEALKAIDAKDANALIDIGGRMDMACENCHTAYWYPNQPLPPADDPRFKGITPNK
jgi:hypothetical protein